MLEAFLISFGVIFVAELGDETMLATITLAVRIGATAAFVVVGVVLIVEALAG